MTTCLASVLLSYDHSLCCTKPLTTILPHKETLTSGPFQGPSIYVSASFYCCLKLHIFKYPWNLRRTCERLILISPYYITRKSNWKWVVSITKTGGFWEPVKGIVNEGSGVVIHMMEHPPKGWVSNGAEWLSEKKVNGEAKNWVFPNRDELNIS